MNQQSKRIVGMGKLSGNALTLTRACARACGLHLPDGKDGGPGAADERRRVRVFAAYVASQTKRPVEISAPLSMGGAIVDVIEP